MYKKIICILLSLSFLCGCTGKEDILRFHVVANSNSEQDQKVKMEIKDALYEEISKNIKDVHSVQEGKKIINENEEKLTKIANDILKANNFNYDAKINVGHFDFPTKTYGDEVFPAGNYQAVKVELGEAKGENWWCVMFPPICFVDASEKEFNQDIINESEQVEFQSIFSKIFNRK